MYRHTNPPSSDWQIARAIISCEGMGLHVSNIAQSFCQFSMALSNVVHLKLEAMLKEGCQLVDGTDDFEWPHLCHFSTVKSLHVSQALTGHLALALEDTTGEMAAEVLLSPDFVCLEGQSASFVEKFVCARRLSARPVTVIDTQT